MRAPERSVMRQRRAGIPSASSGAARSTIQRMSSPDMGLPKNIGAPATRALVGRSAAERWLADGSRGAARVRSVAGTGDIGRRARWTTTHGSTT
jgi:hypothetical protein